jgi:hypothetical protein
MDNNELWDCPVCGEWVPYLGVHQHPCVAYEQRCSPTRLSMFRQCEHCQEILLMLKMVYVRRPLGGHTYWSCREHRLI